MASDQWYPFITIALMAVGGVFGYIFAVLHTLGRTLGYHRTIAELRAQVARLIKLLPEEGQKQVSELLPGEKVTLDVKFPASRVFLSVTADNYNDCVKQLTTAIIEVAQRDGLDSTELTPEKTALPKKKRSSGNG